MKKRTLVIGDIHGGAKALKQVLERSKFNPDLDQLICIGDYVDGWNETYEVISQLVLLQNTCKRPPIYIMGNHDEWFLEWLKRGIHPVSWLQGGGATAQSYINHAKGDYEYHLLQRMGGYSTNLTTFDIPESHRDFFYGLHYYYIDDDNRAFVHGGYATELGKDHSSIYLWDRDLWQRYALPGKKSQNNPKLLSKYNEIFIGHTSTVIWKTDKPMNACNVWNVDTGGGWWGKLTIMDVDTKEYWQSDKLQDLYQGEKGRM